MTEKTLLIYLYFIHQNNGVNEHFFHQIFHFHRFSATELNKCWERMFWFDGENDTVRDVDFENVIRTLIHHEFVDAKHRITKTGISFLQENLANEMKFYQILVDFSEKYKYTTHKENSCYVPNHDFPVSCHLCTERVCINSKITAQDFLNLIQFKGFKNPYKQINYTNPYFEK